MISHAPEMLSEVSLESVYHFRPSHKVVNIKKLTSDTAEQVFLLEPTIRSLIFAEKIIVVEGMADARIIECLQTRNHILADATIVRLEGGFNVSKMAKIVRRLGLRAKFLIDEDSM